MLVRAIRASGLTSVERGHQQEARHHGSKRKPLTMPAQNRQAEPDEHHGEPAHEGGRVEALLAQSIFRLVQPHALKAEAMMTKSSAICIPASH